MVAAKLDKKVQVFKADTNVDLIKGSILGIQMVTQGSTKGISRPDALLSS